MRPVPQLHAVVAAVMAVGSAACVEPFGGSKIELFLAEGVQVPGEGGEGRPPSGTHYEMYVVRDDYAFHLPLETKTEGLTSDLELRPIVDGDDPCMIEDEFAYVPYTDRRVAGLHVTMWREKLLELYQDPSSEGGTTITDNEAGALYDAEVRINKFLPALKNTVVAVTSHDPEVTPEVLADLAGRVPAPDDMTDTANRERLRLCQEFFAAHPRYYVGADRLISLPLNGEFYGVVNGTDPRNSGYISGASLTVDASFPEFDAMQINWQFDDPADPRIDSYGGPSAIGYHYLAGTPIVRTRGVINVPLRNSVYAFISGEAAIYTDLDKDTVHF